MASLGLLVERLVGVSSEMSSPRFLWEVQSGYVPNYETYHRLMDVLSSVRRRRRLPEWENDFLSDVRPLLE